MVSVRVTAGVRTRRVWELVDCVWDTHEHGREMLRRGKEKSQFSAYRAPCLGNDMCKGEGDDIRIDEGRSGRRRIKSSACGGSGWRTAAMNERDGHDGRTKYSGLWETSLRRWTWMKWARKYSDTSSNSFGLSPYEEMLHPMTPFHHAVPRTRAGGVKSREGGADRPQQGHKGREQRPAKRVARFGW